MKTKARSPLWTTVLVTLALATPFGLTACNATDNNSASGSGHMDGSTLAPNTPDNPPIPEPSPAPTSGSNAMTVAVKYVALQPSATSAPTPTQDAVQTLVANLNKVWAQCEIQFVLEEYSTPVASDLGLDYTPANHSQLDQMRAEFDDHKHALLVKTGLWDRTGNLGADGSNGFSTLPSPYVQAQGTVFEDQVSTNTLLVAHEIGHLIGGLDHTSSTTNLMNHFVSTSTTQLSSSQCDATRTALTQDNPNWLR